MARQLKPIRIGDEAEGEDAGELVAELAELAGLLEPQGPRNRSNRVKYRCPSCGAQAWGKPGLRLLCGGEKCEAAELAAVE